MDFCQQRRQEVIEYVTTLYGEERVGQIITFGKLQAKAVIRDVSRVFALPYSEADMLAKLVPDELGITLEKALEMEPKFEELMESTDWDSYGRASGNTACQQCMVHCGHEPSAVDATFCSFSGFFGTIKAMMFSKYKDDQAMRDLEEASKVLHGPEALLKMTVNGEEQHDGVEIKVGDTSDTVGVA